MKARKMIAPVIVTVLLVLVLVFYGVLCFCVDFPVVFKITGLIAVAALIGVSVFVLVERIEEIRSGEEDDLSQYLLHYRQGA